MAIATATAIGLGITAAAGAAQAISGASRARKAKKALENYKRQDLKNEASGLRVSTLGAEMKTLAAQRQASGTIQALRGGGVRGLVGGAGTLAAGQQQVQQQISADLDRQQTNIQQIQLQEQQNIRGMQEKREGQDIQGLGAEMAAGRAQVMQGITSVAGAAAGAAQAIPDAKPVIEGAAAKQLSGSNFLAGAGAYDTFGADIAQQSQATLHGASQTLTGNNFSQFAGGSTPSLSGTTGLGNTQGQFALGLNPNYKNVLSGN
jgi:hypothetical protein